MHLCPEGADPRGAGAKMSVTYPLVSNTKSPLSRRFPNGHLVEW